MSRRNLSLIFELWESIFDFRTVWEPMGTSFNVISTWFYIMALICSKCLQQTDVVKESFGLKINLEEFSCNVWQQWYLLSSVATAPVPWPARITYDRPRTWPRPIGRGLDGRERRNSNVKEMTFPFMEHFAQISSIALSSIWQMLLTRYDNWNRQWEEKERKRKKWNEMRWFTKE